MVITGTFCCCGGVISMRSGLPCVGWRGRPRAGVKRLLLSASAMTVGDAGILWPWETKGSWAKRLGSGRARLEGSCGGADGSGGFRDGPGLGLGLGMFSVEGLVLEGRGRFWSVGLRLLLRSVRG